ncbi:MAG: hypothetical protein HY451_01305 [Parcubacteria group bacterium]|nr:hypothetical protein [Parcubacteria group bacterium]
MFGLIKLIFVLILLVGVAVYGGDIWNTAKDKIAGFVNPELQKATLFNVSKNKIKEIENIVKEVRENIDNPNFDKKAKLEEGLKAIRESKNNLEKIENSGETLIEKAFEGLQDLKQGAQNLFSDSKSKTGENQACP